MEYKELVNEVFKLGSFEDLLNCALDQNHITSMDIIHASDIYMNPDVPASIERMELEKIIDFAINKYSIKEVCELLDPFDVLEVIDNDVMMDHLEDSWALDRHDEDIRRSAYKEGYEDAISDKEEENKYDKTVTKTADELHEIICNYFGISRYDNKRLQEHIKKFINMINQNNYKCNYKI